MKITSWTICNNEIDFLPDVISYHLSWFDQMYVLDTGSTDGTWEFLQDLAKKEPKLIVEKYHTSYTPDYSKAWEQISNPFPEMDVRNYAIQQAEKLETDWLVQLDADEVFLPKIRQLIDQYDDAMIIAHSTINPVCALSEHPVEHRNGHKLYDPHARIWKAKQGFLYMKNPAFRGEKEYHCIPVHNNKHLYHHRKCIFVSDIVHLHLHWTYGKKVEMFFNQKNINSKQFIINSQKLNEFSVLLPKIFWDKRKEWINK